MTRARDSNGQVTPLCESLLASAVLGSLVTPHLGCRCEEKKRKEKKKGREEDSCSSRKERRKSMDEEKTKRGIYKGREVVVVGTYVWWRGKGKGAARAETEARAGATGSDLVILPSNPPCSSLRPLPSSIQPSTLNYRPPLNPFVRAFPVENSRPSLSSPAIFGSLLFCLDGTFSLCFCPFHEERCGSLSPSFSRNDRGFARIA